MTVRSIEHQTKVPEIRKGDTVVVLSGKDAGKRGKVEQVIREDQSASPVRSGYRRTSLRGGVTVVIEGVNIARKHTKPRQRNTGSSIGGGVPSIDPGGILDHAMPMPVEQGHAGLRPLRQAHPRRPPHARQRHPGPHLPHCGEPLEVKA